jgi:hypothetical protein
MLATTNKLLNKSLIFIDTNILLDFYRVRGDGVGLGLLEKTGAHHDRIITGSQVEMEYKKNRQRVILESLNRLKTPDWSGLTPPAFLSDAQPAKIITSNKAEVTKQQGKLKGRIELILKKPFRYDSVYKHLQRLFKHDSPYNLSREKKIRFQIRRLAWKRFILGYPPRKQNDTSIGDAINWEWIISCANSCGKDIILVTRDNDYGVSYNNEMILNDWLVQEFKQRVSQKRKIIITDRLAKAFKRADIQVSKAEEEQESELIEERKYNIEESKRDIFEKFGGRLGN